MTHNITDRAMLVTLSIGQWTAQKHDKKASRDIAHMNHVAENVGRYNKVLIAKSALQDIASTVTAARTYHYTVTLPWRHKGSDILPSALYMDYANEMRRLRIDNENAREKLYDAYPSLIEQARIDLNGMFNESDYPTLDRLKRKFYFGYEIEPLPMSGDFRVDFSTQMEAQIAKEATDNIRAQLDANMQESLGSAMRDLWGRVYERVSLMRDGLAKYGVDDKGQVVGKFHDPLVGNLRDLCDLLPKLNVTGDSSLETMRASLLGSLCAHDPQTLRDSDAVRLSVISEAEKALADMASYAGVQS